MRRIDEFSVLDGMNAVMPATANSSALHCRVLPLGEFTVTIPERHAKLQGVRIPSAILKIVFAIFFFQCSLSFGERRLSYRLRYTCFSLIVGWMPLLYWLFGPKNQSFRNKSGKTQPIRTKFGIRAQINGWQRSGNFGRDRPILADYGYNCKTAFSLHVVESASDDYSF